MTNDSSSRLELAVLATEVVTCTACPRLVSFRRKVASDKKKQYAHWDYWGKPVPGFGDPEARLVIVGLAPASHGGNRTGRVFTGDKSAEFLVRSLHVAGFANQPSSTSRDDGLVLSRVYLTAAVKCAPPDNKPDVSEVANCSRFLERELDIIGNAVVVLCLGQTAFRATVQTLMRRHAFRKPIARFRHGLELCLDKDLPRIFASYHPSPRNTQTGKLTEKMFLSLLKRVKTIL